MAHNVHTAPHTANAIDVAQNNPHQHQEHKTHGGPKLYGAILAALLFLTVVTVGASQINFGSNMTNVIIAMLIASLKASLVALFFMHLRWDRPMNAIIFVTSLFFLGLFLIGCYSDTISRQPTEPTNLRVPTGSGNQPGQAVIPGGQPVAPQGAASRPVIPGHGPQGANSPSGGGPAIPGASSAGSHGGAAQGSNVKTPDVQAPAAPGK
ncbi:MAG TPA: cytochrome C oxidase subunit IV family protein [Bryobacteraceae bacterium]|nr:cytochrome C oxidase subunit IV family protein [Bryobacteraceae bacterium]